MERQVKKAMSLDVHVEDRLTINKEYAEKYVKKKQAEELSRRECSSSDPYNDSFYDTLIKFTGHLNIPVCYYAKLISMLQLLRVGLGR